jgi:hypothetical protein
MITEKVPFTVGDIDWFAEIDVDPNQEYYFLIEITLGGIAVDYDAIGIKTPQGWVTLFTYADSVVEKRFGEILATIRSDIRDQIADRRYDEWRDRKLMGEA